MYAVDTYPYDTDPSVLRFLFETEDEAKSLCDIVNAGDPDRVRFLAGGHDDRLAPFEVAFSTVESALDELSGFADLDPLGVGDTLVDAHGNAYYGPSEKEDENGPA